MKKNVTEILTVTDDELVAGMKFFGETMKMVVEPTGCLGYAALRNKTLDIKGKRVGVIISGGNVDLDTYCRLIKAD
jgi:threonine dehydratase